MVLILYDNLEIGAHVSKNLYYLICLRHLIRSRAVTNLIFLKTYIFLFACAKCSELPSNLNAKGYPYFSSYKEKNFPSVILYEAGRQTPLGHYAMARVVSERQFLKKNGKECFFFHK